MARAKSVLALIFIALLALMTIAAVAVWTGVHNVAPRTSLGDLAGLIHPIPSGSISSKIEQDKRINLLLMARGGAGSDNPNFTDSMIVLSLRPRPRQAVLVSLPRFLLVEIPALTRANVPGKLYTAFDIGAKQDNPKLRSTWKTATGPGDLAAATVGEVTGLPIDGWVSVDIGAFRTIVDALGGIDVTVPAALDDPHYPVDDSNRRIHVHFSAGSQRMNGERALEYARSRLSTSESDRSARQELVLLAILKRLKSVSVGPRLLPLLGALQGRVLTSLRPAEAEQLAELLSTLPPGASHRVTVDATNLVNDETVAGGSELAIAHDRTLASLKHYLAMVLPDPRLVDARVPIIVSDGSNAYQLPDGQTPATIEVQLLSALGWNARLGPDRHATPVARTRIVVGPIALASAMGQWMADYFESSPITTSTEPAPAVVQVILGADYTTRSFP